jgi:hypothetical protein
MMKRGAEKCELQICWGIWEMKKWAVKFLRWIFYILIDLKQSRSKIQRLFRRIEIRKNNF